MKNGGEPRDSQLVNFKFSRSSNGGGAAKRKLDSRDNAAADDDDGDDRNDDEAGAFEAKHKAKRSLLAATNGSGRGSRLGGGSGSGLNLPIKSPTGRLMKNTRQFVVNKEATENADQDDDQQQKVTSANI